MVWNNNRSGSVSGPAYVSVQVEQDDGTEVEFVPDILHPSSDLTVQMAGRDSEFGTIQSGYADLTLRNLDGTYTPGVVAAPVALAQDMPLTVRETVGRRTFDLFNGALGQPEAAFGNLPNNAGDKVTVTAIDWTGQQQQGRTFISNLAEWIILHGGNILQGYWPMTETAKPFLPAVNVSSSPTAFVGISGLPAVSVGGDTYVTAATTTMPIGEDAKIATVGGPLGSTGLPAHMYRLGVAYPTTSLQIGTGEVFTIVAWRAPVIFTGSATELLYVQLGEFPSNFADAISLSSDINGHLTLATAAGSLSGTISTCGLKPGVYPVAIRWGFNPPVFEAWINRTRYVGSLSGSGPTGGYFFSADSGTQNSQGGFGHLQIYAGDPNAWTFADYLAQIDHATSALTGGLRWQRTDERLRSLARYAGLADSQLHYDRGVAYMPRASLAGTTWQQQSQLAVDTEQGRVFIDGAGRQVFHNRVTTKYDF